MTEKLDLFHNGFLLFLFIMRKTSAKNRNLLTNCEKCNIFVSTQAGILKMPGYCKWDQFERSIQS